MKKKMASALMLLSLSLINCGCGLFASKPDVAAAQPASDVVEGYQKAEKLLSAHDYKGAAKAFDDLLVQHPASELDMVNLFNSGAAYEGLGQCETAARRYRSVLAAAMGKFPRIEAQAVLRLSYVYECLGEDNKVVGSLLDSYRRRQHYSREIAMAEIPARLAAAYARVGQRDLANRFFGEAEEGLKTLAAESKQTFRAREILAKTLYLMGKLDEKSYGSSRGAKYLYAQRYLQAYLLQAVELEVAPWAQRSHESLTGSYRYAWKLIETVPRPANEDLAVAQKSQRQKQIEMARLALQNIDALKALRFPTPQKSPLVDSLFHRVGQFEKRLQAFLASLGVANPLTTEAEKREGLKRQGRVYNPNPVLENKARKRRPQRKTKAKEKTSEAKTPRAKEGTSGNQVGKDVNP